MPPHKQLEALIRVAARHFRVEEDQLRVAGGRYHPLVQFRQLAQLVAFEQGHGEYQIAKAFGYTQIDGTSVKRNISVARKHASDRHRWWSETKPILHKEWSEELG